MSWLRDVESLAAVLESRAPYWIAFLQREPQPFVRHPSECDRSLVASFDSQKATSSGIRVRCMFAANPRLVSRNHVPQDFFSQETPLRDSITAYLLPFFPLDGKEKKQEHPCLMWRFSDFIELEGEQDAPRPFIRVSGALLADLQTFPDIQNQRAFTASSSEGNLNATSNSPDEEKPESEVSWAASETAESLRQMIERLQDGMQRGDFYLANASTRLNGPHRNSQRIGLRRFVGEWLLSPVRHGVFIACGEELPAVCCFSPERFILRRGAMVQAEPIKGTAPVDPTQKCAGVSALWKSEKEMCEQTLVTDLLRNDLNKVCRAGSVAVTSPFEIHATNSLLQMQSLITGELKDQQISNTRLLGELLPAGSVTGTPKWAVSREICTVEATPRGYYTGVFALARSADELDSTVLIRGFFADDEHWKVGLGAGITMLSDPDSEVREFDLKWQSFAQRWKRMTRKDSGCILSE